VRRLLIVVAVLALAVGLRAETGIAGSVTDARTRQPIAGAAVCTGHGGSHTDSSGHYFIRIEPGTYQLHASATGYQTAVYPESVVVVRGRVTEPIDFALEPLGVHQGGISGRVTDSTTGDPVPGALITAEGPAGRGQARSYACGGYQIAELPPGRYRVCASATGYEPAVYPESVTVVPGQITSNVNFALRPSGAPAGGISGRVRNGRTGVPIQGALVLARGPNGRGETHTYACGGYQLTHLPAGRYEVSASATGFEPAVYPESVLVVPGQVAESVNFCLVPTGGQTGAIAGYVYNVRTREPIRGALLTAIGPNGSGEAHTCQRGGYRIADLPSGPYQVCARAQGFEPAVHPDSVVVVAGGVTDGIDFFLEPVGGGYGGISGAVTNRANGEPIFGALVVAQGPGHGQANTCMRGNYHIGDLPAGVYLVTATARGFQPSGSDTVEVRAGQVTQGVDFALAADTGETGGIAGMVTDSATNAPLVGANVFAWSPRGQGRATTDSTGSYLMRGLLAGDYLVRACARGYCPQVYPESVHVEPGRTTERICFALTPARSAGISGFVYDGVSQSEISGAHVTATGPGGSAQAYSGAHGDYLIEGLEPGIYDIAVSAPGYNPGTYFEPVLVEPNVVASFVNPPLYQSTDVTETGERTDARRLWVAPNVFSRNVKVRWQMPECGPATLRVFDRAGRAVTTLVSSRLDPGSFSVLWNGTDDHGRKQTPGTYFLELRWPNGKLTTPVRLVD